MLIIHLSCSLTALEARTVNSAQLKDIVFPVADDLVNFTAVDSTGDSPAQIIIPAELLEERLIASNCRLHCYKCGMCVLRGYACLSLHVPCLSLASFPDSNPQLCRATQCM